MKNLLLIFCLGCFLIACNAHDEHKTPEGDTAHHGGSTASDSSGATGPNHMKDMHDAMNRMMDDMKSMSPTGDPDHDFAMMMKHHHQGAVDMAKSEISGGNDEKMKAMAQKMIDDQQKEIASLDRFLQSHQASGNSDFGHKAMGMMTPMSNIKMESTSLDAMFASMMIPHHEDAVTMAKEYLKVGKNDELRMIARNITQTQPKEVDELQNWLAGHKNQ